MAAIDLKHIARLARLRFKEEELKLFESQVTGILKFVDELRKMDVTHVEPTSHPLPMANVFREDAVVPSRSLGKFFEVPKIIEK